MFDNREFLIFQSLSKFIICKLIHDLGDCTIVEHRMLKIFHVEIILVKRSTIYGLYILEGSNVVHFSQVS